MEKSRATLTPVAINERFILKDMNDNLILKKEYTIVFEDVNKTFNINMHSFSCFAFSVEEAIGICYIKKPQFRALEIEFITSEDGRIDINQ